MSEVADPKGFWESRYAEAGKVWSGKVNAAMSQVVEPLPPGRALDLGCGEGGDAIWLALHGWTVTAVDVAANALERAGAAARDAGVGEAITWVEADLATWLPETRFDLVSACFLQSPISMDRFEVLRRSAAALDAGGLLLVVAHASVPPWSRLAHDHDETHEGGHDHRLLDPAAEVEELALPESDWELVAAEARPRIATGPNGEQAEIADSVVLYRRR